MSSKTAGLLFAGMFTAVCLSAPLSGADKRAARPVFKPDTGGGFAFDTGVVSGKLREGGNPRGITRVVHTASGLPLTKHKQDYGLLSFYRVFSGNRRYGVAAWSWPGDAALNRDGSVESRWPAADDRPFDLSALYRWAAPNVLDLEATVLAREDLPDFEVFAASYLAEQFTSSEVCAKPGGKGVLTPADDASGPWQMFPRDRDAVRIIQNGRWKILPNPVDWVIRPEMAAPVAVRRDAKSGTAVILMSRPGDCFAISTPKQTDNHYSTYFSLFGRSIKAGGTARARMRLVVETSPAEDRILELYRTYAGRR